jgi:regulatory protein
VPRAAAEAGAQQDAAAATGTRGAALSAAAVWLARRDYCSVELAQRLADRGFDPESVQAALRELTERRFLDDARYARAFVAVHAGRGQGPLRIRQELTGRGLPSALADEALQAHAGEQGGWATLARRVRVRRFGDAAPPDRAAWARQARFLHYRGFSTDHIREALGDEATDGA